MSLMRKHFLEFVVQNKNQWATNTSPEVTQVTLEKSSDTFLAQNLCSTINCSSVLSFFQSLTTFHHQSSSDSIKWISESFWRWCDDLGEQEFWEEWCISLLLFVTPDESLTGVITSEISLNFTRNRKLYKWKYQQLKLRILDIILEFHLWPRSFYNNRKDRWIVFLLQFYRYRLRVWFLRNQEDKRKSNWNYQQYLLKVMILRNIVPFEWLDQLL